MEFFKRSWVQTQASLQGMSRSERSLIVTLLMLGVILVVAMVFWATRPDTVSIGSLASGRSDKMLARLHSAGVDARSQGGQIVVPVRQRDQAIVLLAKGDLLDEDWAAAFDEMVAESSPWLSAGDRNRRFLIAKQKVLSQLISAFDGVRRAQVFIDMPPDKGFGQTTKTPSASVSLWMSNGRDPKSIVEGIAGLVSGAVSGMRMRDVRITDARGRSYNTGDPADPMPGELVAMIKGCEKEIRAKIEHTLQYINGVLVAVSVQLDPVARKGEDRFAYDPNQPLNSERNKETSEMDMTRGGAPGPRSNMGLEIVGNAPPGRQRTDTENETEMLDRLMTMKSQTVFFGRTTKKINATVNVPRNYFVSLYWRDNPDSSEEPDRTALNPIIEEQKLLIREQIEPILLAQEEGKIAVNMIPDTTVSGMASPEGSVSAVLHSGWVGPMGVGLLAVLSLGLMLFMVRKATRSESLPSVEELAGVPPTLPLEDDLVGEVEEQETSMQGLELDETQLKGQRMAEQIGAMIKASPNEAGSLLGKWVRPDD